MDANTPEKGSASAGNPIQDKVDEPSAQGSAVKGSAARGPAVERIARPKGPNAAAIVLGLLAMVFGGLTIAKETLGWHVDWSRLGPGGIIGIGVLMVVIGAVGLVRRQGDV